MIGVVTADRAAGIAALHDLDPEFRSFSRSEKVAAILESLHIKRPLPVQSMYIFKVGFHTALVCIPGPGFARSGWACHTALHARSHMSQSLQLCMSCNGWWLLLCGVCLCKSECPLANTQGRAARRRPGQTESSHSTFALYR